MRVAVLGLLAAILVAVGYVGGEQHRQSCILEPGDSNGCSVLPWSEGQAPKAKPPPSSPSNLFDSDCQSDSSGIVIC